MGPKHTGTEWSRHDTRQRSEQSENGRCEVGENTVCASTAEGQHCTVNKNTWTFAKYKTKCYFTLMFFTLVVESR